MCDRTQEFLSLVHASSGGASSASSARLRRLQGSTGSSSSGNSSGTDGKSGKNAFPETAREIARGIHRTSSLLTRLTSLVRKQGLFDDPTEEINTLIFRIKQDLDALNAQCDGAQQSIDRHAHTHASSSSFLFGRGSDTPSQLAQHNVKVVSQLKGDLFNATKGFKQVLELRSSKMKDQQLRRVELVGRGQISALNSLQIAKTPYNNTAASSSSSSSSSSSFLASSSTQTSSSSSVVVAKKKKPLPSPYASLESGDSSSRYALPYSEDQRNQQQQQQQLLLEPVAAAQYYDAREQAVTEVEKTIGELGSLFKRLATMLQEQQELVERIDEDVENAVTNTESAKNQLVKALESASSNRGMFMKIGGILAIFILIFVLFLM